jgi:hypothetical protein
LSPARLNDDIRTAFGYARVEGDGRMNLSVIILGGVVAGTSAFAPPCAAQTPARTGATVVPATAPNAAVKKPGAKPGAAAAQPGGTVVSPATMPNAAVKKPAAKPRPAAAQTGGTVVSPATTPNAAVKKPAAKLGLAAAARRTEHETGSLPQGSSFSAEAVGWKLIEDAKTGVRLGVPEKLVPRLGASRSGTSWSSAQGQIQIETFRLPEAALPALFDEERKSSHRRVASSNFKPDGFFILGTQGLKSFVVRAEAQGSEVRGVTVLYDQATEGTMSGVALAVANAFVGFPNPNVLPPAGLRRRVEYASAIVVSSNGALVTGARNVDRCEVITVPPFGHAERTAEDKTNGLALVRLYGAHNLAPAPFAESNIDSGDLTLIGVADPLVQNSDAVTVAPARLSQQTIEPPPKPGFSGAAAADARGRLVGMVDLRPGIVAGNGAGAAQTVTIVPVETIRAFLQAQQIAPAGAPAAAINQSVVRVICVRK